MFKFAENLLNNLDQTAQSTVQTALEKNKNVDNKSKGSKPSKHSKNKSFNHVVQSVPYEDSVVTPKPTSISASNSSANLVASGLKSERARKEKQDAELFENFLNQSEELKAPGVTSSTSSLPNASLESSPDKQDVKFIVGSTNKSTDQNESNSANDSFEVKEIDEGLTNANIDVVEIYKTEIVGLNEQIKGLMTQIRTSQNDYQRARKKLESFQSQNSESDKIIRELRSREEDLSETIKSKDSQLGVLRVRFSEVESELMNKKAEVDLIKAESERLLKDHSNSSDVQSQAFETLKQKVKDLETSLDKEKEEFSQAQKDFMSMQNKLEFEKQNLSESVTAIEMKLNVEKTKNMEMASQLKNSQSKLKASSDHLKQELEDYKLKAAKTLQAKDRIIAQLKESSMSGDGSEALGEGGEGSSMRLIEIEELKSERDYLKDELDSKASSIELLRAEIAELETQTSIEIETLKDEQRSLLEQQEDMKQTKTYLEQDLKSVRQQLDYAQEELYKQKSGFTSRLQEKEAEVDKLRAQLTIKNSGSTTEKELENRLHLLTENLIQKQTLIEGLQSENHSIFFQLERSEKRLQDYETIMSKSSVSIAMNDNEEGRKDVVFRESPYDHEVTRKVKRAATEIDKFSIRLGVFLKKYPIARIFVLFYMFLLHLWVVVVLFTYTPEAHGHDYGQTLLPQMPKSD